jgi:hypothetical protein
MTHKANKKILVLSQKIKISTFHILEKNRENIISLLQH